MGVFHQNHEGAITLFLDERLDMPRASELEAELEKCLPLVRQGLSLDCSRLIYLSSAGLRVILKGARLMKSANQSYQMTHVHNDVYKVLNLSGFTQMIKISRQINPGS